MERACTVHAQLLTLLAAAPTAELPYEISCDIGFENRLALENTRLLLSYAMVDPPRLRTLVLFREWPR